MFGVEKERVRSSSSSGSGSGSAKTVPMRGSRVWTPSAMTCGRRARPRWKRRRPCGTAPCHRGKIILVSGEAHSVQQRSALGYQHGNMFPAKRQGCVGCKPGTPLGESCDVDKLPSCIVKANLKSTGHQPCCGAHDRRTDLYIAMARLFGQHQHGFP
jgi:hypothetical protein